MSWLQIALVAWLWLLVDHPELLPLWMVLWFWPQLFGSSR
jgi:hypothetical protein